jgi:Protein of unknown function (DUF1648)
MRRLALMLFITLVIASAAYVFGTIGQLPQRVAMHFGGSGQASGSMPRDGYLLFMLGFAVLFPLFIVAAIAGLPLITKQGVKLPNREYWLSPTRRDETLASVGAFGGWLGCLLTVFAAALHYTILAANTSVPPRLSAPLLYSVLGGFLAAMLSWQALFFLRFRTPH